MQATPQPTSQMLVRGLMKRCPRCGQGGLFRRWITMTVVCPRCGLHFEREQGYWLGAVIINTAVTFALFLLIGVAIGLMTWPEVPWGTVLVVTLAFNGTFPVLFYPFSKTIWVAADLVFRPVDPERVPPTFSPVECPPS